MFLIPLLSIALIPLVFKIAIIGMILYLILLIPMHEIARKAIYVIVIFAAIAFLAELAGFDTGLHLTL